jgi:alanine dehydrogenase
MRASDDILIGSAVIVDDVALSRATGALAPARLHQIRATTFGQVLRGEHPGRSGASEITVYAPVGLPWPDPAAAWMLYQKALASGRGTTIDLLR